MGFDLRVEEARPDGTLELTLDGPDRKPLMAKDGELLLAIEFVLNRMGRRAWPDEPSVRLVCRGFRSERDDELVSMVREAAAQVARSGVPRSLRAMRTLSGSALSRFSISPGRQPRLRSSSASIRRAFSSDDSCRWPA